MPATAFDTNTANKYATIASDGLLAMAGKGEFLPEEVARGSEKLVQSSLYKQAGSEKPFSEIVARKNNDTLKDKSNSVTLASLKMPIVKVVTQELVVGNAENIASDLPVQGLNTDKGTQR